MARSLLLSHLFPVIICSRLLASAMDLDISKRACALLREARHVTYQWMGEVHKKLDSTHDETSRVGLQSRLFMLAATCFSTFDVCPEHVPATLANEEDFSIAIQCAAIAHDNIPQYHSGYLTQMLSRHHRLLHNLEPIFSQPSPPISGKLLHSSAYDDALARLWGGYRPSTSTSWHALPKPNSRWISTLTERGQTVHYDLLTGELLIGGKRLGRLPPMIVGHSIYASIFGTVSGQSQFSPVISDLS